MTGGARYGIVTAYDNEDLGEKFAARRTRQAVWRRGVEVSFGSYKLLLVGMAAVPLLVMINDHQSHDGKTRSQG